MYSYVIGRSPPAGQPCIIISDESVSRSHARISVNTTEDFLIEDLGSVNGTFVRQGQGWTRIHEASVSMKDELRLGTYVSTIAALLQQVPYNPKFKIERNPDTGQIVRTQLD